MARAAVAIHTGRTRIGRGHLAVLLIAVVAVWLVLVFGRALGDLDRANARQEQVRIENLALEQRLAAQRRELALVQADGFQALQARAFGMGAAGELVFSLAPGAPSPPVLEPLGLVARDGEPATPLDAWLELLFDS